MANSWLRLYSEFASDPKVQMMTEAMQRRYIMLLCMRCSNSLVTLHDDEVAFQLRISAEELAETKALFIKKGFVTSTWDLPNWEKRQFVSDSSKDRVAKHRALQKQKQTGASNADVTLQKQKSNALDTDTDTDTEVIPPKPPSVADARFDTFWLACPKKIGKDAARKAFAKRKPNDELLQTMLAALSRQSKSEQWMTESGRFIPNPSTWLNEGRWMDGGETSNPVDDWFVAAGFDNPDIANNMGCYPHNAHKFHNGQLDKVAA